MYFSEKIRSVYDPVIENLLQLLTAAVAQVFGVGERRRCRDYGDFAAGSGVDVVERGGNVGNFATRHVRELNCEGVTDRLCNAILRF
jgi:hypothetical protein